MKCNDRSYRCVSVPFRKRPVAVTVISLLSGLVLSQAVLAAEIDGTGDVKIRWDNTFKYSAAFRLKDADSYVANYNNGQPNTDFGDLAFGKGMINNRIDWLSEMDIAYKNLGARVSASLWYDGAYHGSNAFPTNVPNTQAAILGVPNNQFPDATKNIMGQHAGFNDAFVFGNFDLGDQSLLVRLGQQTQIYGETLFLGANGIAAAQGPVDLIKAFSQPNAQFKEVAMPVPQIAATLSLTPKLSVGAYYQFKWKPLRLPAAGSYFSPADFIGDGSDLLLTPPPFGGSGLATRGSDFQGSDDGNWGLQMKFNHGDVDYGLYAVRYDDKAPIPVVNATTLPLGGGGLGGGVYNLMYAKNIKAFGASFSTVIGGANVAGEISTRRNVPIAVPGDMIINTAVVNPDNNENTPYARGNSLHINLSTIALLPETSMWKVASVVGEVAFNRLLSVSYNPNQMFDPLSSTHTRDAIVMRVVFQPEYFGVLPDVNIQVPIGIGYGVSGRSAVVSVLPEHGGDFSIGVNATIHGVWKAGLNYTKYFGSSGTATSQASVGPYASYKQYYSDRDFINFSLQRTF
nr:DUF1302 family protein [uncultured Rhodoferax sp.]